MLTADAVRPLPKVVLHDHLDGGLRPQTVLELARAVGYRELPTEDPDELGRWFLGAAHSGSLERYLETFAHTVAVMQTRAGLARVAAECALDLARDGVVYAEIRFAPELHVASGLELGDVVEAVLAGAAEGAADAAAEGHPIRTGILLTAMRTAARSTQIAELAVRYRDDGVAGFDIAGAERGFPPSQHLAAFDVMHRACGHVTIHAGEGFGLPSIWEAVTFCGADRLGHGVRIVDDITTGDLTTGVPVLGRLAAYVRDRRIPLELCPTSNVQTGVVRSIAEHPLGLLTDLGFRVTVNTDNRLMSGTSMTAELVAVAEAFGYGVDRLRWFTVNAMKSAFLPFDERLELIDRVIKPGYATNSV